MKSVYFFLPDYPEWSTGGHKYHTLLFEYFRKKGVAVYSFGHHRFTKAVEKNKLLKIVFGLYYILRIPSKSVIIQSNTSFLHSYLPLTINKIWKKHYYFTLVHHLVRDEKPSKIRMKMEDYFIRNSDKVITISQTTRKRLYDLDLGLKDIRVFNPGLDAEIIPAASVSKKSQAKRILFVGTVTERKGLIHLISAMSKLNDFDIKLDVVGGKSDSVYYDKVKQNIMQFNLGNNIFFHENIDNKQLRQFYLTSDVFVFPTFWEGYGMVAAEAMAYGLPVIASKISAIEELIEDGVNGILVEPGNSDLLSDKINLVLRDEHLSEKLSRNAMHTAKNFPTWDETSEGIYSIVSEIIT